MDADAITEEVVRRLMEKIKKEQGTGEVPAVSKGPPIDSSCQQAPEAKKLVITQEKAANISPGSKVSFPKGTIITPLARDIFRDRGVTVSFEQETI